MQIRCPRRKGGLHLRERTIIRVTLGALILTLAFSSLYTWELSTRNKELQSQNETLLNQVQDTQSQLESFSTQLKDSNVKLEECIAQLRNREELLGLNRGGTPVSRNASRPEVVRSYQMSATAYGSTRLNGGTGTGLVALGRAPVEGRTLAVDPNVIPLGSRVLLVCQSVPDVNGVYTAEDTGGAIGEGRVDIYFDDINSDPQSARKRMLSFGHKDVIVHVLKD